VVQVDTIIHGSKILAVDLRLGGLNYKV